MVRCYDHTSQVQPQPEHKGGSGGRVEPRLPVVFGRYLLLQRLSRGGMGEIFLAKHGLAGFEKLAVIKKVLPNLSEDSQFISRFVDEAQVAIKLAHVNIAQVFEVGRVGDEYFLALEYVDGRDLRRTLSLLAQESSRFPIDIALLIGREMANGLSYAHRRVANDGTSLGLVHCDISPPNVMVSFEGETKIIDFGIARSAMRGTATDPKMGFGKFGYMAPEQLIRGGVVDHRTDIYAAGVVLFELLTGQRLYEPKEFTDYRALARAVAQGQHRVPSDIDPSLAPCDDIITTALSPHADDRYATAADLRDSIQRVLASINPTVSTDQLSSVMRGLFAKELAAQRELQERIASTHLSDFQEQLNTQAVPTVSFALSEPAVAALTKRSGDRASRKGSPTGAPPNGPGPQGSPGSANPQGSRGTGGTPRAAQSGNASGGVRGTGGTPRAGQGGGASGGVRSTGGSATVPAGGGTAPTPRSSGRSAHPTGGTPTAPNPPGALTTGAVPLAASAFAPSGATRSAGHSQGVRSTSSVSAAHRRLAPAEEAALQAAQAQALRSHRSTMIIVAVSAAVVVAAIVFVLIRTFFYDEPAARIVPVVQPIEEERRPPRVPPRAPPAPAPAPR